MTKLGFLYFGRLDEEKWIDLVIDMVEHFGNEKWELPFRLFVFHKGTYESEILDLSDKYVDVHYFGFQPLSVLKRYIPSCHYSLMPSRFLETFWLTALNALSWGLPVIGFGKWGLKPFILPELDLLNVEDKNKNPVIEIVQKLLDDKHENKHLKKWREESLLIADKYDEVDREKKLEKIFENEWLFTKSNIDQDSWIVSFDAKKVLMVSDFKTKLSGIETYVRDAKKIMEDMKMEVKIFWVKAWSGILWKVQRYLWLVLALLNDMFAGRLWLQMRKFEPDVVWFHSVIRWIGWESIWLVGKMKTVKVFFMFHDFGYFAPWASKLTEVEQLPESLKWKDFLKSARTKNLIKIIFLFGKWLNVICIRKVSKKYVDKFLVPSAYMKPIVEKLYGVDSERVEVLEHFVQKGE